MKIDELNWKILSSLQTNSRESFSSIGRKIGLTSPAVAERVKKMEDTGVLEGYIEAYFNPARPHQGLSQRIPAPVSPRASPRDDGKVVSLPILGGLHHDYRLAA